MSSVFPAWSPRRHVALALLAPGVVGWWFAAAGVTPTGASSLWLALALLAGLTGGAVLASYVPARGWRPEVGCSPCATMAAVSLVGATIALHHYGNGVEGPAVAFAVTLFGLSQRLTQSPTCPA